MLNLINFAILLLLLNGCAKPDTNSTSTPPTSSGTPPSIQSPPPATECKNLSENECLLRADCKFYDGKCHTEVKNTPKQEKKADEETGKTAKEEPAKKAKEEADRIAKEESDKLAKEEADRKAKEEADRLAKEEADRLAKEEADRLAKEEAIKEAKSKDGIIKQIQNTADKNKLAANITEFLTNNSSSDDIKAVISSLAVKDDNYVKDVYAKLTVANKAKIKEDLKAELTAKKSEFKADLILDLGYLFFTGDEQKNFTKIDYAPSVDYSKSSFGDMLINKRIKDNLADFNAQLEKKYNIFRDSCKIENKDDKYNKERFYFLLRTKKIGNNYLINELVNLPSSKITYSMLKDLLDNTENAKEFLNSSQYLLLSLTNKRNFTQFKTNTILAEEENEKIKMIGLLLDKGGIALIKEQSSLDALLSMISDNKLNIDTVINSSTVAEIEKVANFLSKADYDNEKNAEMANKLLNKILENKDISAEIKRGMLDDLLSNKKNKFINEMVTNLVNKDALIDGIKSRENLVKYILKTNDLINLIKDDKNKKAQQELLTYLSQRYSDESLDLFLLLLQDTKLTSDELKASVVNFCHEKWHGKKNYNREYIYNNKKRINLIKELIALNTEIPKNIQNDDVSNILESSKNDAEILKIVFKNESFLNKFLNEYTDKFKTEASFEALKSCIENSALSTDSSELLAKVLTSKSIDNDKWDELFNLLIEKGANLNKISDNKTFEEKLRLVPDNKMSQILSDLINNNNTNNNKIKIAVAYAVENLKDNFKPGLLELTNKSNVARDAVIDTAFNVNKIIDLIENPEKYGLAREKIIATDYPLRQIKLDIYSTPYEPANTTNGSLFMYLFSKMIDKKENSENIKKIVLLLKKYFKNKEEWLNYLLKSEYKDSNSENEKYNFMRFIKDKLFVRDVSKYYEFIDSIGTSKSEFGDTDKSKLLNLLNTFDIKNVNKSMGLFYDFYLNTFLFLNEEGIEKMEKYLDDTISNDNNDPLYEALKIFDEAYFKLFEWK